MLKFLLCCGLLTIANLLHAQYSCNTTPVMPAMSDSVKTELGKKRDAARQVYLSDTTSADALIWYGRREAYLGNYHEAIRIFSNGILKHPLDARLYRHRGHRFISLRCFDAAIADFEKAAQLIRNKPDEVEPDGMPNALNIPTSTLQSNIWYHLGLAYYVKRDYARALDAYRNCLRVSNNNDMYVATANWLYITLRKMKKEDEAAKLLATISPEIELIENKDYLRILLLYKKQADPEALKQEIFSNNASSLSNASVGYGLGNYFLLNGDKETAKKIFEKITAGNQWASFGFIAAEAALKK
jgi:tetratricopeptide (TPR) repeat protein